MTSSPSKLVGIRREQGRGLGTYGLLRMTYLLALLINALALTHALSASQYADYSRGAFFAVILTTVALFGQEQQVLRGRLSLRTLQARSLILMGGLTAAAVALAVALDIPALRVILSSCVGTAAMMCTACSWVALQAAGRDSARAVFQLANGVTVQMAALLAAAMGGGALAATNAATTTSVVWLFWALASAPRGRLRAEPPYRESVSLGILGVLSGMLPLMLALVASTMPDADAVAVRFFLLAYTALLAICTSVNSEYFRVRLYKANEDERRGLLRQLLRVNVCLSIAVALGLLVAGRSIPLVLDPEYALVGDALSALGLIASATLFSSMLGSLELSSGRVRITFIRSVVGLTTAAGVLATNEPTLQTAASALAVGEVAGLLTYGVAALIRRLPRLRTVDR